MKYRLNGQAYYQKVEVISENGEETVIIPKKGYRERQIFYVKKMQVVHKNDLKQYIEENHIDLSSSHDPQILIFYEEGTYYRLGLGPYTMEARDEILKNL